MPGHDFPHTGVLGGSPGLSTDGAAAGGLADGAATTTRTERQLLAEKLGVDLELPDGKVRPTATGDWPTLEGRENLVSAMLARASTSRGELVHRPEYGAGVPEFVETLATPARRAELVVALRQNLSRDPRVAEVAARLAGPVGGRSVVTLLVRLMGAQDARAEQIEFTLE